MLDEKRYDVAAELAEIRRLLAAILEAVASPNGLIADFRSVEWSAGGFADLPLGGRFAGVWIRNTSAAEVFVGFAPGTGSALRGVLPIPANDDLSIPFPCSFISIGGAADGAAVIGPLLGPAEPGGVG